MNPPVLSVPHAARRAARHPSGFTLVELLITALVIGTAFIAASWSMTATARTQSAYGQSAGPAAFLAREIQTLADGLPRAPSGITGATSGAAVTALDALIGASFTPAIHADGSVALDYAGWSQVVDLSVYDLDDPSQPTDDDPALGLAPESSQVYRLDVSVLHGDELIDTFSWWIHP